MTPQVARAVLAAGVLFALAGLGFGVYGWTQTARGRGSAKRGGNPVRVSLTEAEEGAEPGSAEIIAVHDALTGLAGIDPRKSQIVELRYFGGLSVEEIAELIGLSARTVKREWRWARAWLYRELSNERPG